MGLVSLKNVKLAFGGPWLLDGIDLNIEQGERICLLGRNGEGKSTLLKVILGDLEPDHGERICRQGLRLAFLPQEVPGEISGRVQGVVVNGLEKTSAGSEKPDPAQLRQVDKTLSILNLDPAAAFETLSAGRKRQVLLARGLARDPDLLLLDEPTNHLDIDTICRLEEFLLRFKGTLLFVTHDRSLLRKLATRIIELDRGRLFSWACGYESYLKRRQTEILAEERAQAEFDKKLAKEETWIRQGIRARRTRNEGRVRALEKLRKERGRRREGIGTVRMQAQEAERTGRLVIEAKGLGFGYDPGDFIVRGFTSVIMRGDRVGIIGPNGSGKTTLLRLLLARQEPTEGTVRHGTHLQVAYFDQLRAQLDGDKTVLENVSDGNPTVTINGKTRQTLSYLKDFLFTPDRAISPVAYLSGGEKNRLVLARLFTQPSNVLVLDEPTNDLDAETLEQVEELLQQYQGTVLLVSHDRSFLNHVVTHTLVLEGEGRIGEYAGGYDDWLLQRKAAPATIPDRKQARKKKPRPEREPSKKLNYREQQELKTLPQRIEELEADIESMHQTMMDPAYFQRQGEEIAKAQARLAALEEELRQAYARWEDLESRNA